MTDKPTDDKTLTTPEASIKSSDIGEKDSKADRTNWSTEEVDYIVGEWKAKVASQEATITELVAAATDVMEWLRRWEVNFGEDEDWPAVQTRLFKAISKAKVNL